MSFFATILLDVLMFLTKLFCKLVFLAFFSFCVLWAGVVGCLPLNHRTPWTKHDKTIEKQERNPIEDGRKPKKTVETPRKP